MSAKLWGGGNVSDCARHLPAVAPTIMRIIFLKKKKEEEEAAQATQAAGKIKKKMKFAFNKPSFPLTFPFSQSPSTQITFYSFPNMSDPPFSLESS